MFGDWEHVEKAHVVKLLQRLRDFYSEDKWLFWPLAEDDKGVEMSPLNPKATKFCLMGACDYLLHQEYVQPMADCISCATREYLDELSNHDLIHGKCGWSDEMALINMGLEELAL